MRRLSDPDGGAGLFMIDLSPRENDEALFVVAFEFPDVRGAASTLHVCVCLSSSFHPASLGYHARSPVLRPFLQDAQRFMWLWGYQSTADDEGLAMQFEAMPSAVRTCSLGPDQWASKPCLST